MTTTPTSLNPDARILLIDDEFLVLWALHDALEDIGFQSIRTAGNVRDALAAIAEESFHFAFLDVNLGTEKSFPIASELELKGVPYAFVTGYGSGGIDEPFRHVRVLTKPVDAQDLRQTLTVAA